MSDLDRPRPTMRLTTVCVDCDDTHAMADFYGKLLGWDVAHRDGAFIIMQDPITGARYSFSGVPGGYRPPTWPEQPGAQDKQMHFEIRVEDLQAAVGYAIECGAQLAEHQGRRDIRVMLDPAGHPFCLWT